MTLITYSSRIHFADGVLEAALQSEMEARRNLRPLIVAAESDREDEATERVLASLPLKSSAHFCCSVDENPTEEAAIAIARKYNLLECDCLIAIGAARAIDLAKVSRLAIGQEGALRTRSNFQSVQDGSTDDLPVLYAVPDMLGLAAAVSPHATVIMRGGKICHLTMICLIPTATICDLGLMAAQDPVLIISTAVDTIARCIEAYMSGGYHPPAAGMALDGLERAVSNLEQTIGQATYEVRREIMAACLNSSLAQQRGLGATQVIGNALCVASGRNLDRGALSRVILPEVLHRQRHENQHKLAHVRRILDLEPTSTLTLGIKKIFETVPLAQNLSGLGLSENDLEVAANLAAGDLSYLFGAQFAGNDEMLSLLHAVR